MQIPIQLAVKGKMILGMLHVPKNCAKGNPIILIINGLNGNRIEYQRMMVDVGKKAEEMGVSLLRFDCRGLGLSEGEFWNTSMATKLEDIREMLSFIYGCYNNDFSLFILGFSDGAKLALKSLEHIDNLAGLILWSPVLLPLEGVIKKKKLVREPNTNEIVSPFGGIWIGTKYIRDMNEDFDYLQELHNFKGPKLCTFGTNDIKTEELLNKLLISSLSTELVIIPDAGHTYQKKEWSNSVINQTIEWVVGRNYLDYQLGE